MSQRSIAKVFKTIKYAVDYFTKECSSTSKDFFTFYQSVWETKVTENRKHYYSTLVQIRLRNPDQTKSGCYEVDLILSILLKPQVNSLLKHLCLIKSGLLSILKNIPTTSPVLQLFGWVSKVSISLLKIIKLINTDKNQRKKVLSWVSG